MADNLTLSFEIYRGDELLFKEQINAESVTIGKGPAAMLRIEDEGLADLQAVINLSDEGAVQILDLVGSGTKVNGDEIVNSELVSGDNIEIGDIRILVEMEGEITATNPVAASEDDEVTDASVHTVGDIDFGDRSERETLEDDISEDVMAFIMRSGTAQSDVGIDRSKPQVLEVAEIWGDVILDVRHFHDGNTVTLGTSTGFKWYMLGQPISWIGPAFAKVAWLCPPLLSEVREEMSNDFYVPTESLPTENFKVFVPVGKGYACRFSKKWAGFVDVDGERKMLSQLIESGDATTAGGDIYEYSVNPGSRVVLDIGHVIVFGQMVHQSKKVKGAVAVDYPFLALLAFVAFLGAMTVVAAHRTSLSSSSTDLLDAKFVELLVKDPEKEDHREKDKPAANPDAGEGAKAKKEEGKVGKKDAKMEKAKGNKVEIDQQELDREMADNAGLMGSMADQGGMDGILGDTIVDENMMGGIGGALGAKGYQMGAGGLGSRGSGLGGGGSASGLGGTGTRGRGGGSTGFGSGAGNFGPKGEGGIGRIGGDPIILGALDKSLIDRVIKRNLNQIKYCYSKQLNTNPTLNGKIVVKFVISGDGSVSQAKTHSSTMTGGGAVTSCINSRFLRFQFPEPKGGGIVIVKYPFLFAPQ